MQPVAFPGVEAVLRGWLASVLPAYGVDIPISTRVPNPRPPRFIRLQRTGGPKLNPVTDGAQITVECWDDDQPGAADTARIVRAVLGSARNELTPSGDLIYQVREFVGPAVLPDVSGQPRYSWTVQVHMRGTVLQPVV